MSASTSNHGTSYRTRSMGPVPVSLSHPSHSHLHHPSGSALRNPQIVPSSLLDSGASSSLTSRYGGGPTTGPSSLPLGVEYGSNSSVPNYPAYLNMNLNNGPPPTSSLDCTQTGSLNMPLMGGLAGGASAFNMNLNLAALPPHLSTNLGVGLNSSSLNSQHLQQSAPGFPPPPSQFLGNLLPSYSSVSAVSTVGYGSSSTSGGGHRGGSESGSSASSADLGIGNTGKGSNLLMSLSSRGRQGTLNSSEEDRDRDESPMVCVQQSPVASH